MDCDCWIGIMSDYTQDPLNDMHISTLEKQLVGLADPLKYVDGRTGYSTIFNYCPLCGKKIAWREIRARLKLAFGDKV